MYYLCTRRLQYSQHTEETGWTSCCRCTLLYCTVRVLYRNGVDDVDVAVVLKVAGYRTQ